MREIRQLSSQLGNTTIGLETKNKKLNNLVVFDHQCKVFQNSIKIPKVFTQCLSGNPDVLRPGLDTSASGTLRRYLTQCPRRAQLISVLLWFEPHLELDPCSSAIVMSDLCYRSGCRYQNVVHDALKSPLNFRVPVSGGRTGRKLYGSTTAVTILKRWRACWSWPSSSWSWSGEQPSGGGTV